MIDEAAKSLIYRQNENYVPFGPVDESGRWHPDPLELGECCEKFLTSSDSSTDLLFAHSRTAEHVAVLYQVEITLLRERARQIKEENGN